MLPEAVKQPRSLLPNLFYIYVETTERKGDLTSPSIILYRNAQPSAPGPGREEESVNRKAASSSMCPQPSPIHNFIKPKKTDILQPLSFKTASKLASSPRNEHHIDRNRGVGSSAPSKQRTIQQRTSNPSNDVPPMLQRWLGESARDQPYGNVDAFYSVGGKTS